MRHGSLVVDLPPDWRDQSTLLFVGPGEAAGAEAVGIRLLAARARTADAILDAELAVAARVDELKVTGRGVLKGSLGDGVWREAQLTVAQRPVRQLLAVFVLGSVAVLANASAPEPAFAQARPRFLHIFTSLRAVPT